MICGTWGPGFREVNVELHVLLSACSPTLAPVAGIWISLQWKLAGCFSGTLTKGRALDAIDHLLARRLNMTCSASVQIVVPFSLLTHLLTSTMAAVARVDSRNSSNCYYKPSETLDDNDSLPHVSHPKPVPISVPDETQIKAALYSPSVIAKIWGVASRNLNDVSTQPITHPSALNTTPL